MQSIPKLFIIHYSLFITLQGTIMSAEIKHIKINDISVPVVFEKQNSLPTFNMQLVFQNNGYIKDGNKSGLAAICAKILNEGTKELGAIKFAKELENRAITLHASHGFETFVIELAALKSEYKYGLKLLNNLLKSPNLTKKSLDKIKTIQIGSLKRKENDFDFMAQNQLKTILFKKTPLQNPSSGTIKSIEQLKLKDIKEFIKGLITLNNLIIVAGGDLEFDEFKREIQPILKEFKAGKKTTLTKIEASNKAIEKVSYKETEQAYIYFGSPFYLEAKDKDTYKAKVASFILGGSGFGSRLMEEIRVKRGLAYSAYGHLLVNKSHSYFTGYLQTKLENANKAKKLVQEIIDTFIQNGVTQKELDGAKRFLTGSEPLRSETLSQRQSRAFSLFYKGLPLDYPKIELEKIETLTLKELNNFIKSHKEIKNLSFSIVKK